MLNSLKVGAKLYVLIHIAHSYFWLRKNLCNIVGGKFKSSAHKSHKIINIRICLYRLMCLFLVFCHISHLLFVKLEIHLVLKVLCYMHNIFIKK